MIFAFLLLVLLLVVSPTIRGDFLSVFERLGAFVLEVFGDDKTEEPPPVVEPPVVEPPVVEPPVVEPPVVEPPAEVTPEPILPKEEQAAWDAASDEALAKVDPPVETLPTPSETQPESPTG